MIQLTVSDDNDPWRVPVDLDRYAAAVTAAGGRMIGSRLNWDGTRGDLLAEIEDEQTFLPTFLASAAPGSERHG